MSVIVPFYNAEDYLQHCIESICKQSLTDIEIILVDDGSTDGSAAIASAFASADDRVRVVTQSNAGPGGARNRGVAEASGTYLTFVDADDIVRRGALLTLVRSAQSNNADITVGAIRRFNATRSWLPRWAVTVHSVPRQGIVLDELPALLRNNYSVGKAFYRAFWLDQGLAFREHVAYEDQPLIAQLMSRASSINVLTDMVYDYRQRDDRSSISQRPEELGNLTAHAAAWRRSRKTLGREASPAVIAAWYGTVYDTRLQRYLDNDSIADRKYWRTLRKAIRRLRKHEPVGMLETLTAQNSTAVHLLDLGLQAELIDFRAANGWDLRKHACLLTAEGPAYQFPLSPAAMAALPAGATVTPKSVLALRQRLLRGRWSDDGRLHLAGHAHIGDLTGHDPHSIELFAKNDSSGATATATVKFSTDPARQSTAEVGFASAYEAEFDVSAFAEAAAGLQRPESWALFVRVTTGPYTVTEPLRNPSRKGGLREMGCPPVNPRLHARFTQHLNRHVGLHVVLKKPEVVVDNVSLHDRELRVSFRSTSGEQFVRLHVNTDGPQPSNTADVQSLSDGLFSATLRIPKLPPAPGAATSISSWTIRAENAAGKKRVLNWDTGRPPPTPSGTDRLYPYRSAAGNLKVEEHPHGCLFVTDLTSPTPRTLSISAIALGGADQSTHVTAGLLAAPIRRIEPGHDNAQHAVSATLDLSTIDTAAHADDPLIPFLAATMTADEDTAPVPIVLSQQVVEKLPWTLAGAALTLERANGRTLALRVLAADE